MPKLRRLSGAQVIRILEHFGFTVHSQRGSHVKLRRIAPDGVKQTLTIPQHRELDTGTLRAIFRQASRYILAEELRPHFYAE
ncbi:MAG: type II toxin-antitoxin system HicA family toxin [Chloroflexi bacterium]|nr:type II toxin-antitoxin system HicA family toxin [Chloroflexota bacterium]